MPVSTLRITPSLPPASIAWSTTSSGPLRARRTAASAARRPRRARAPSSALASSLSHPNVSSGRWSVEVEVAARPASPASDVGTRVRGCRPRPATVAATATVRFATVARRRRLVSARLRDGRHDSHGRNVRDPAGRISDETHDKGDLVRHTQPSTRRRGTSARGRGRRRRADRRRLLGQEGRRVRGRGDATTADDARPRRRGRPTTRRPRATTARPTTGDADGTTRRRGERRRRARTRPIPTTCRPRRATR